MLHLRYLVTGTGRSGTVGLAEMLTELGTPCSHERFFNGNSLDDALRLMETNGGENSKCSQHCGLPGQLDRIEAESSYMAAPYLDAPSLGGATVIHAVRNPWKVILSFLNNLQFFRGEPEHEHEKFVYSVLPQLYEIDNSIDRAVYYFIHWNLLIERLAQKRREKLHDGLIGSCQRVIKKISQMPNSYYVIHRIEDGSEPLLRKLGLPKELIRQYQKKKIVNAFKEWPKELGCQAPIRCVQIEHINASKYASELRRLAKRYGYPLSHSAKAGTSQASDDADSRAEYEVRFAPVPRLLEAGFCGYNLVRWRSACYALPQREAINLELTPQAVLRKKVERGDIVVAPSLSKLREGIDELIRRDDMPQLLEAGYRGYNLVRWRTNCYALPQGEAIDLEVIPQELLGKKAERGEIIVAQGLSELRTRMKMSA